MSIISFHLKRQIIQSISLMSTWTNQQNKHSVGWGKVVKFSKVIN